MSAMDSQQIADLATSERAKSVSERLETTGRPMSPMERFRHALSNSTVTILVVLIAVLWSIPTFGLFFSSFRPPALIASTGWWTGLVPPWHATIQNYQAVIQGQGFGQAFINSLIIAIPGTLLPILIGSFAAYAFAWMKFPGRDFLFLVVVAMPVWIVHTAFGLPFAIFLLTNFFAALPKDLIESAHIDGASSFRTFWNLIIPLSVPALASLAIFQFMWVWNDLLIALIFLGGSAEKAPLTLSVANLVGSYGENYQLLTAAAFISMALPLVVFFSLQRYFVRGILAGSVKG